MKFWATSKANPRDRRLKFLRPGAWETPLPTPWWSPIAQVGSLLCNREATVATDGTSFHNQKHGDHGPEGRKRSQMTTAKPCPLPWVIGWWKSWTQLDTSLRYSSFLACFFPMRSQTKITSLLTELVFTGSWWIPSTTVVAIQARAGTCHWCQLLGTFSLVMVFPWLLSNPCLLPLECIFPSWDLSLQLWPPSSTG